MANWVTNIVITKDSNLIKEKFLTNDRVDFSKVIPCPKEYDTIEYGGSMTYRPEKNMYIFHDFIVEFKKSKSQEEFVQKIKTREELRPKILKAIGYNEESLKFQTIGERVDKDIEVFIRTFYCYHKYGIADSNEWHNKNWGCKWNGSYTKTLSDNAIKFETPWSIPFPVYKKLAEQDIDFAVLYADEDLGHNCGLLFFDKDDNGEISCSVIYRDNLEFACLVKGYSLKDICTKEEFENLTDDDKLTLNEKKIINTIKVGYFELVDKIRTQSV